MHVLSSITASVLFFLALWHLFPAFLHDIRLPEQCDITDQTCEEQSAKQVLGRLSSTKNLDHYSDTNYGFSFGVPSGWSKIVYDEFADYKEAETPLWSEPGHAVGFESPRSHIDDQFADYILIEVLPGDDNGLFETTIANQRVLELGADSINYDRLLVDSAIDDSIDVDLIIFQRGVQALGYTISFYAIGEPANEQVLFDAFQIMLRTFSQTSEPFVII